MSIFKKFISNRRQEEHEQALELIIDCMLEKAGKIS
jgi:hypothetical protein